MKRFITALIVAILAVNAPVKAETEFYTAKATAYCINGTTATGTHTTEGRTVASKKEWFGKTMVMFVDDGDGLMKPQNYIGTYIVEDTGGKGVRSGKVIDVYIEDYDRAVEFGCKDVIIQIIDAEG